MDSIIDATSDQSTPGAKVTFNDKIRASGTHPLHEQRRGSTPAVMVNISGHRKLCRVARGQRVVLGSTPPVFVAELRPSASSEFLTASQTPPKSRSPLSVEIDEAPVSSNALNSKLLDAQDSDLSYTSGSEHSALSRNTSEASETLSQDCAYSPTITTTTAPSGAAETYSNARSPANALSSPLNYEFGSDFSKLSLQDSGYSGSFPLCSTNSDASSIVSPPASAGSTSFQQTQASTFDGISPEYYASLLDFTLKLGYSEAQLKSVLNRLGTTSPGQDKVLAELIKLGQDVQDVLTSADVVGTAPAAGHQGTTAAAAAAFGAIQQCGLRSIVVDGSNVAMTHGNKVVFSCLGIRLCVDWFRRRGHTDIKVFVPQFRKEQSRSDNPITDQHILFDLESENALVWTPSRRLGGRRIICHDDRYILKTAVDKDAVIVSNDEYRDMIYENPDFRRAVEERLLMYNFIDGKFVVPDDPLGRYGPKLDQFLSKSSPNALAPPCPYGRKCTYGNKCKFYHPERPGGLHRSVTERLRDHAEMHRRISPTNSLQYGRLGTTDSIGDFSLLRMKNENAATQKPTAFRTQSLNPASLLRQNSSNAMMPGRYSPPSSMQSYQRPSLIQSVADSLSLEHNYQQQAHRDVRLQRLQADGHATLSKQMSNPEAARNHCASVHGAISEESRYLMPPSVPPPGSFLRHIWQNEQAQRQAFQENRLQPHQPVVRNMSAPGVNILRQQTQFSCAPPPNNVVFGGNFYANDYQRKNSVSDSQLNLLGVGVAATTSADNDDAFYPLSPSFGGSNYFIPSTTVWGPVENSSSPIFTSAVTTGWAYSSSTSSPPLPHASGESSPSSSATAFESARSKVHYHLAQLFPEEVVSSVMLSNPNETDPQKLCSLILAAREQKRQHDGTEGKSAER